MDIESDLREVETIKASELQDGDMKQVQVGPTEDEVVLISRVEGKYYATSAKCSHLGGVLEKGVLFGNKVMCPLHSAGFSVIDGQPDHGPTVKAIPTYEIREEDGTLRVKVPKKLTNVAEVPMAKRDANDGRTFLIIGGGPASLSAAETLRQSDFKGEITIITSDQSIPYDRTFLSKAIFDTSLPKLILRGEEFLKKYDINVRTNSNVKRVNLEKQVVELEGAEEVKYDKLLIATGARPNLPPIPGADLGNVFRLRLYADMEKIRDASKDVRDVVVIGGSFIAMETAACIKKQFKENINVTVVVMEERPFANTLGVEVGAALQQFHEEHGVTFKLKAEVKSIEGPGNVKEVVLGDGTRLPAEVVILGTGVRPNSDIVADSLQLAEDKGIIVDKYLRTTNPNVFAAGDVASVPFWYAEGRIRIEHYSEAMQHGQIAAYNMLNKQVSHDAIPFFWTRHYDKSLQYVGIGGKFDDVHIEGDPKKYDFVAYYGRNGRVIAASCIGRTPATMIISQAMQVNIMPSIEELKSKSVSLDDIKKRVEQRRGHSQCKRRGCQLKKELEF